MLSLLFRSFTVLFPAGVVLTVLFVMTGGQVFAQPPTDCGFAIGVCSNRSINQSSNGMGIDDFAFPGNNQGCLVTRENQSVWLYVQVETGGTLGFDIIPNVNGEDFDFAVFGPNVSCMNLGMPTRCSYAAPFGSWNTGMNGSNSDLSEGGNGNGYVRWLNTQAGESYYVLIDNFGASFQGFTLNWLGNSILDCTINLPCPVFDLGPDISICEGSSMELGRQTGPNDVYFWSTGASTPTITVSDSGMYWQEVTRNGCAVRDSIYVSIVERPVVDLGSDTLLCEGSVLTLNAANPIGTGYLWQDGYLSPVYNVTQPGTYTVEVFNGNCIGTDQVVVEYDPMPVVDLGPDTVLCNANGYMLNANTSAASAYLWQDGSTGPAYVAQQSGTYWVQTSNTTCTFRDSVELRFGLYPQFDLGIDPTLCEGDTLLLDAYAVEGTDYLWQDGSTSVTYEAHENGTYSVTVSNDECSATDSVTAVFLPYPTIDLGPDTTVCAGDTLVLDAASPLATATLWQDGSSGPQFNVTGQGTYGVTVSNGICPVSDAITVQYNDYPIFSLGPDTLLCRGTPYPIEIQGNDDYLYSWEFGLSGNSVVITDEGEYILAVENQCGVRRDTITVTYGSCNCDFFMPTGFTPNGDGYNDRFIPIYDCDSLQDYSMEIYNRWGELIFATDRVDSGWLGLDSGNMPMDSYIWQMRYSWTWRGKAAIRREQGGIAIIR